VGYQPGEGWERWRRGISLKKIVVNTENPVSSKKSGLV
jgi:hypothetical protein